MATINKIIIILMFVNVAFGLDLEVSSAETYGTISLKVSKITDSSALVTSNSNLFNVNGENSFGSYLVKGDLKSIIKSIKKIKSRISKIDQSLTISNSSLKSLYKGSQHDFFIVIDGKYVARTSPFYKKLKIQIAKIIKVPNKNIIKEIKLVDSDLSVLKDGSVKKTVFDKEQNCSGSAKNGVCKISDLGFISL